MQNSGQYGVSDAPQYVVGRQAAPPPPQHLFSISHDNMSIAPQHHLPHHLQAQHHHFGPHPGHQSHPSLHQIHPSHAQRSQPHPQFPHPSQQAQPQPQPQSQPQHQQQSAQVAAPHQDVQQQQQVQAQQQAMVQQLGLGGADSPEVPSPGVSRPSPSKFNSQLVVQAQAQVQEDDGLDEGRSAGGSRWPRQETLALIKIRSEMDTSFRDSGLKGPLWEEVSRKMGEQGYSRTAKKCKEKFENVHKYYKKTKDGKAGRQDGKSYRFFTQLEALYSGQQEAAMQLGSRLAASAAASLLTDTAAAASLLTGSAVPDNGVPQTATATPQPRQPEVSTGVTLSESISDDDDDDDYDEHPSSKKRKRTKSQADLFSSLMSNLVAKQESMQQTFLEFMERREQERQARDEAWRRQELARFAREHELRVQEQHLAATRDAALVAFLQKVTGQTLTLPTPPTRPLVFPVDSHPAPPPPSLQLVTVASAGADTDPESRDSPVDPNSKRWPKPEVLTLIKLRSDMEPRFQEPGPKAPLWEEISQGMACLGYNRNQKRCKEKWENINKYFRKTKESNKKRPENAKTCPYFHQLELLYTQGVLGTPHNKSQPQQIAKAPEEDSKVDHQAVVVPLAPRIDAAPGDKPAANSGNGSNPGHLFSSPENGSSADRKAPESST